MTCRLTGQDGRQCAALLSRCPVLLYSVPVGDCYYCCYVLWRNSEFASDYFEPRDFMREAEDFLLYAMMACLGAAYLLTPDFLVAVLLALTACTEISK
ncbi:hypothetical protein F4861DRAFT_456170 [Xylaria intraflava]|nr:hypothetical protein F4861DRAFT_456170 [Xylaria intraflava]